MDARLLSSTKYRYIFPSLRNPRVYGGSARMALPVRPRRARCRPQPSRPKSALTHTGVPEAGNDALALCRSLLTYSAPGAAVMVPHAALAELVELASGGTASPAPRASGPDALQTLYDVAALAERYNRAPSTVRGWFHDGLFGPPEERRFRGRGYVATSDAVRCFEERTGLCPAHDRVNIPAEAVRAVVASPSGLVDLPKQSPTSDVRPRLGEKIRAAAKRPPR